MKAKSDSGRTSAELSVDAASGALTVVVSRDGRVVHHFNLNREIDLNDKE